MTIDEILSNLMQKAFVASGYEQISCKVVPCVLEGYGDFQCNDAMQIAKIYKKAPFIIAEEAVGNIEKNEIIEKCEVVKPGFINFYLNEQFLASHLKENLDNVEKNIREKTKQKNIIVDYGGANVAKSLHIGHLRSAIIGESIKRICKIMGHITLGDIHLGDWGLQMGMIINEIRIQNPDLVYFDENYQGEYPKQSPISAKDLETIYPQASQRAKADEKVMEDARKATFDLQNGRRGYIALWRHFVDVSLDDQKKIYKDLNVDFDLWLGESDSNPYIHDMIEKIKADGFAKQSQGALVVDIKKEDDKIEIPPFMLVKTDGSVLYSTTDLATIVLRDEKYQSDEIIYLADNRQELHFTQLFRVAEKTKIVKRPIELKFVGFGTMNGKDGKPYKTRSGGVMKLSDLIGEVKQKALEKIEQRQSQEEISTQEMAHISNVVANASLKFADLSNYRSKDYIFDLDKFTSFEGKTGPYILYTITRIKSILRKSKDYDPNSTFKIYSPIEKEIALHLLQLENVIVNSYNALAPSYLCDYAYKLANLFSTFYSQNVILKEEDSQKRNSWLSLCQMCQQTLEKIFDLLAIPVLEKM